jgi:NAD-dependent deacetylase sirtuin 2
MDLLKQMLGMNISTKQEKYETFLKEDLSLQAVANAITEGKCKNIIVMSGAGISVAAGIPDFRTPGTGLYDNL